MKKRKEQTISCPEKPRESTQFRNITCRTQQNSRYCCNWIINNQIRCKIKIHKHSGCEKKNNVINNADYRHCKNRYNSVIHLCKFCCFEKFGWIWAFSKVVLEKSKWTTSKESKITEAKSSDSRRFLLNATEFSSSEVKITRKSLSAFCADFLQSSKL